MHLRASLLDALHLRQLLLVLHHHDVAPAVLRHVPGGVGTVGGVDPGTQTSGYNGGHSADVPLRSVEPQDVDGVEGLETKSDEGLGDGLDVIQVLSIGPLDPLVIPLHSHGNSIGISLGRVVEHRPDLKQRAESDADERGRQDLPRWVSPDTWGPGH